MALNVAVKRSPLLKCMNVSWIPSASVNTENLRVIEKPTLESASRGTGYRSSFNGIVCTIFGGTGLYGANIISRLGKDGTQLILPHRCSWENILPSRVANDLGQMQFLDDFKLDNEDSIRKAIKYSDVVINLIGKDWDTYFWPMEKVHVDGARRIAKICREMGVKKLIHVSALNASPNPPEITIKGGSKFLKTKWYGEQAVREEFPDAVIVRPSDTYHAERDRFFSYYGSYRRLLFGNTLYLNNKGLDTYKMPVYMGDVSSGISELVRRSSKDVAGKTYQFVGPRLYNLHDLMYYMYDHMFKDEEFFGFSIQDSRTDLPFNLYVTFQSLVYWAGPRDDLCWERFEREHITDQLDDSLPNLRDLGVRLNYFEEHVFACTRPYCAFRSYVPETSEYQQPPDPPVYREI